MVRGSSSLCFCSAVMPFGIFNRAIPAMTSQLKRSSQFIRLLQPKKGFNQVLPQGYNKKNTGITDKKGRSVLYIRDTLQNMLSLNL